MKRAISLLLLCSIILAGCGQTADTQNDTTKSDTQTDTITDTAELSDLEKRQLVSDDLPEKDFGGREFNIISRTNFTYEFDAEQSGDVLDDAIYNRNRKVEERFNVDIITHPYGEGNAANVLEAADKSIMAGDDAYQLLSAYTYKSAPGSVNGNYANWYDMPYVNFDKPWWSNGFIDEASVNGKVYIATGDLSLLFSEVTLCILFNKGLAEDLKLGDLYQTVRDGDWTLDLMEQYCAAASSDLNGDGVMDDSDRWGLGINTYTHIDCFLYAFEVPVTTRNSEGIPEITINCSRMIDVVDKLYSFLIDSGDVYIYQHPTDSFAPGMFESNLGLFMTTWLGNCANLREMDTDFGIIPYPKFNSEQDDYCTYYLDRTSSFLVPVTADREFVGIITEAMAAESYKQVIPAFYETALKTKYARDNESQEMIDLILGNIRFDFGNIYTYAIGEGVVNGVGPGHLLRELIIYKSTNFASLYAQRENTYKTNLQNLIDSFEQ